MTWIPASSDSVYDNAVTRTRTAGVASKLEPLPHTT